MYPAITSCFRFPILAAQAVRLKRDRIKRQFKIDDFGDFEIFRETVNNNALTETPVVLVIGFRLKLIRSNRILHWLFQRVCILTTPFWCGLDGFSVKLWMVDPVTKNYLGIYEWRGKANADRYIDFLMPILKYFSIVETVRYQEYPKVNLESYLARRLIAE